MRTAFLSCHFGDPDRELVRQVETLLESHGLRVVIGEELGGGSLTPEVMGRIEKSDALVALMTKRSVPPDYGGTHPWVVDEFKHAKSRSISAIALVAPGVSVVGAYHGGERSSKSSCCQRKATASSPSGQILVPSAPQFVTSVARREGQVR
jgi:hypothetical protein